MYINAYKETCDNLYLVKGPSLLPMISYEIEKILYKDDVCETAQDFLPKLKKKIVLCSSFAFSRQMNP